MPDDSPSNIDSDLSGILESPEHTHLGDVGGNTEGPLWHPDGYLTFVSLTESRLYRWDEQNGVSLVREGTGEGNGCAFDREGRLIMCEGADHRRITRMDADGTVTPIAERWDGMRFHKPNDLVTRSDGSIYFTDPSLRLDPELREYDFAGVFRLDPNGEVHLATDGCEYPNGLAFSPDESVMYVAISRASLDDLVKEERGEYCPNRKIRAFDVAADGSLSNNRVFADMSSAELGVPDGMKVDTAGRVFCTGSGGIWVFEPDGTHIGVIRGPEVPRNIGFGGPDYRTVYTTPGTSIYSFRVTTPGIKP